MQRRQAGGAEARWEQMAEGRGAKPQNYRNYFYGGAAGAGGGGGDWQASDAAPDPDATPPRRRTPAPHPRE